MKKANTKSSTVAVVRLPRFRACLLGTIAKGKKEVRVRRMKYIPAASYAAAADEFAKIGVSMAAGMKRVTFATIAAPLS